MLKNVVPKAVRSFRPLTKHVVSRGRKFVGRKTSHCGPKSTDKPPCFDIRDIVLEYGQDHHATRIRRFLKAHFWPVEPSAVGLWIPPESEYLEYLTNKYATTGHRVLALERNNRSCEMRMVGFSASNVVCPWHADELDQWANCTTCIPSRNRLHFTAHLIRKPNLFSKYHVPHIFEIETLAVADEVQGLGVGTLLLKHNLDHALELRYPLIQVICTNIYTAKICAKLGMKREWSISYEDYKDDKGRKVFLPRKPHLETSIYTLRGPKC